MAFGVVEVARAIGERAEISMRFGAARIGGQHAFKKVTRGGGLAAFKGSDAFSEQSIVGLNALLRPCRRGGLRPTCRAGFSYRRNEREDCAQSKDATQQTDGNHNLLEIVSALNLCQGG